MAAIVSRRIILSSSGRFRWLSRSCTTTETSSAPWPNLAAYGESDGAELAAAYAYGLARNHGFSDGNKRIAWVVTRLFLADNGLRLSFDPVDAVRIVEALTSGALPEAELAAWFRERLTAAI